MRTLDYVRPIARSIPLVRPIARRIRTWAELRAVRRRAAGDELDRPERMLTVDPRRIRHVVLRDYDKKRDLGSVLDGDWDRRTVPFERLDVWEAFAARFRDGAEWSRTPFYRRIMEHLERGTPKWGCATREAFDARCRQLDELYERIRRDGFLPQSALDGAAGAFDDVSVCIDRDGRLLFEDGRHRLCIARLLELESIPVQVSVRHRRWMDLRREIRAYAAGHGGSVYAPLPHPDLADWPSTHGEERFEMIRDALAGVSGTLLDIGAHWGHFCHRFEALGFACTAVESGPQEVYFLGRLRAAAEARFDVFDGSIFDLPGHRYDVTLALNIFHHFLKRPDTCARLERFLERLETRHMVFQPHLPDGAQMAGAYRNFPPEAFVEWVRERCGLPGARRLGVAGDGRPVYLLE